MCSFIFIQVGALPDLIQIIKMMAMDVNYTSIESFYVGHVGVYGIPSSKCSQHSILFFPGCNQDLDIPMPRLHAFQQNKINLYNHLFGDHFDLQFFITLKLIDYLCILFFFHHFAFNVQKIKRKPIHVVSILVTASQSQLLFYCFMHS